MTKPLSHLNANENVFVYIIARASKGTLTRPVKVGIATNPKERLKGLGTSSPFKLGIVHCFSTPDREAATMIERAFHQVLKHRKLNGEWFRMEPEEAVLLMAKNYFAFLTKHLDFPEDEAKELMLGMLGA